MGSFETCWIEEKRERLGQKVKELDVSYRIIKLLDLINKLGEQDKIAIEWANKCADMGYSAKVYKGWGQWGPRSMSTKIESTPWEQESQEQRRVGLHEHEIG